MTVGIIYFDRDDFPGDFCDPEPFDEAVAHAKELAKAGFETRVFKLVETHYFKEANADAGQSG